MITQADCFVAAGLRADLTSLTVPPSGAICARITHPLISNVFILPPPNKRNTFLRSGTDINSKLTFDAEIPKHTQWLVIPLKKKLKN